MQTKKTGNEQTDMLQARQEWEKQQKLLEASNRSLELRIAEAEAESRKKDDLLIQQSRLNAMGEMISYIAHRWRQPLNNIGLIIQNLQLAYKANDLSAEELHADVVETMRTLHELSATVDEFRNFFSYEQEASTFTVNDILCHALAFIQPSLNRKGIDIQLAQEPDVTAVGYPNDYMQVFFNIMLNAKGVLVANNVDRPLIRIRIFREYERSVVTIHDNGGGISEDIVSKIYDPYFTTKQQNTGFGIGLYMAKLIIEKKMHGSLSARNVEGGAEFRIVV